MKRILMVNLPFSGHTNPTLDLARTFVGLGHEVTYIHSPAWRDKIEATGATFVPYDNYRAGKSADIKSWAWAYETVKRIGKDFDCLVYEMLFTAGKSLADQLGLPSFRLFSTFALNEQVLSDFGRTGGFYLTLIFRFPILQRLLSRPLARRFAWRYADMVREMVDNAPELNFVYTVKEFQVYPDQFPAEHYHFVGPSIGHRTESDFDFSNFPDPIVYISLGTLLNNSPDFFKKCIQAFGNQKLSVIMSVGDKIDVKELGNLPDNIFLAPFLPQLQILERASLFITHGGMNSVNEALYYGVPMLVVPMGNDQPRVAQQVADVHVGKRLNKRGLTVQQLQEAAGELLEDKSYQKRAQDFQNKCQTAGGNQKIAQLILDQLEV
ncbi:macrolide family glycosyltransferase [Streptococcus massiliensis]|uniref:Glycosyltransferase n=1 Tax=Streptococcus massiliensis TaxID=313439 RepID=A0A380KXY3_9STRE|nr:macrolide family glycosyltransferase [Streptococcus massiliensis]SUN76139.1 glycosyltransferase [Streptococcus massiliensis]